MSLTDKTALITGGGSGIGWGVAQALAGQGCRVAISGRREEKLREAAACWRGEPEISIHTVDVAVRQSVADLFSWADEQFGQLDIFVNCSGINIRDRSLHDMSADDWDRVIEINLTGAYNCLREVLPRMEQAGGGFVVQISSIAGKRAFPLGGVAYGASKFGMTDLGLLAGNEYAQAGVRVTNIYPGEVDTPILDQRPEPVSSERRAAMVHPDDIGQIVATLAALPPRAHVPELVIKPLYQPWS